MSTESTAAGGTGAPRTLAEELRRRDDASLAALLRARPDLLSPVPNDLSQLATRAGTRASVVRALEHLDRFALQAAEALAVAGEPAAYATLHELLAGDDGDPEVTAQLPGVVARLRTQALVWGAEDKLRLVRTARELLAPTPQHPSPTGLGPTVAEATAGMSPGRLQDILRAAGLPSTHDPVSAVRELSALFRDRERMPRLLDEAPVDSLDILGRLVWGPPYGQVTHHPAPHVRWLLDRGVLLPASVGTVVLPREAALYLRAGRAHRETQPVAPAVAVSRAHDPAAVDAAAAGQAYTALATVEELLKEWEEGGPTVLRAGGLSVRDLKRTAAALGTGEPEAAFWVELAYAAGLVASDGQADERYAATPEYDDWLERPSATRWSQLAAAWLTATRTPGLVGGQDAKGRALNTLGPGIDRTASPEVRQRVLALLGELPAGSAGDHDSVLARLLWERPPRGTSGSAPVRTGGPRAAVPAQESAAWSSQAPRTGPERPSDPRSRIAEWVLAEAELLGVTGRGALSVHGRALVEGLGEADAARDGAAADGAAAVGAAPYGAAADDAAVRGELAVRAATAARLLTPLLPEPLDHVLLQADLTAVAPGPLRRPLAELLDIAAEVESKGGATVYRFTAGSVRRALDAGQTATDLHAFLTAHSRTPVPQPLAYLIDDVARKHGHLRVGGAGSYVRCDDDSVLNEIMADTRSGSLRLRRLAPTVLASQADPGTLLDGLRALGFAPSAESADGDVMITRALAHRTPPRAAPVPVHEGPPAADATLMRAALRAIRAGDDAATVTLKPAPAGAPPVPPGQLPRTSNAETLATMQAAVMTGEALWIGYVNAEGAASQRVIAPVRVEGGFVTAYDHTADEVRTYPLHRITGVAELADS